VPVAEKAHDLSDLKTGWHEIAEVVDVHFVDKRKDCNGSSCAGQPFGFIAGKPVLKFRDS